jgi:hypothetical protein
MASDKAMTEGWSGFSLAGDFGSAALLAKERASLAEGSAKGPEVMKGCEQYLQRVNLKEVRQFHPRGEKFIRLIRKSPSRGEREGL